MTALIRVRKTVRSGNNQPETSTLWRGTDVTELSKLYPPSDIMFADPLGRSEIEGGHIHMEYTFERLVADEWTTIEDPRVRLTPMTATERAIDAENRRQFPGDYGDADDEQYDTYGTEGTFWYDEPDDDPVLCRVCDDRGCELCSPGLSEEAEPEPANGYCIDCKNNPALSPGGFCTECEDYWKQLSLEEDQPLPDNVCPNCELDVVVSHGKLCKECEDFNKPTSPLKRMSGHIMSNLRRFVRFLVRVVR